jgi:phage/plasmid-like protein (TIGR03299 family)
MSVLETVPATVAPERRRLMGEAYDLTAATSASEARALAGLDWEAVHAPLYVDTTVVGGALDLVEKERAVLRNDTGEMFGVVGREHKILTNADFFDFADTLLTEAGLTWGEAQPFGGALAKGKQPFIALRLGSDVMVGGVDRVGTTLLLANGHVGNSAFNAVVTPERTGCSNIVRAAIRQGNKNLAFHTVQHSGDLASKVSEVRAALSLTTAYMREFANLADRMAAIDFDQATFNDFLTDLVPVSEDAGDRAKVTAENQRAAFRQNWRDTLTLTPDLRGTAWGALNVITEVIDHGSLDVRKSAVAPAERRMNSVHFGAGARLRDRAFSLLGA